VYNAKRYILFLTRAIVVHNTETREAYIFVTNYGLYFGDIMDHSKLIQNNLVHGKKSIDKLFDENVLLSIYESETDITIL
jgi:hypothetical protein